MKLLFFGTYHSTHPDYGLSDTDYFEQVGLALDVYSNYEKFLLAGDFNVEEEKSCLNNFLFEYNAKNLVKEMTCFNAVVIYIEKCSTCSIALFFSYKHTQRYIFVKDQLEGIYSKKSFF